MKTKALILLFAMASVGLGACDDSIVVSVAEGSTECSFDGVTAGARVRAECRDGNTSLSAVVYALSDMVDSARVVCEAMDVDSMVALPYNESFQRSGIPSGGHYDYSLVWDNNRIDIYCQVSTSDGKVSVKCSSSGQ